MMYLIFSKWEEFLAKLFGQCLLSAQDGYVNHCNRLKEGDGAHEGVSTCSVGDGFSALLFPFTFTEAFTATPHPY